MFCAYSNEDGAPYGMDAKRGYVEIARPEEQREMKMQYLPARAEGEDIYDAWKKAIG